MFADCSQETGLTCAKRAPGGRERPGKGYDLPAKNQGTWMGRMTQMQVHTSLHSHPVLQP